MERLEFWLDPISPYAALAFERLPQLLAGVSHEVVYRPVLFAGLLKHWGQLGPAEIAPKRDWTYRHVLWLAHRDGVPLDCPAAHPFDPLPLLRLAWAAATPASDAFDTAGSGPGGDAPDRGRSPGATPSRWVVEAILRHVWRGGADAGDAARLEGLTRSLAPPRDPADPAVKQALRNATDAAIARGVFGVPTIACRGRLFWGLDGLEMLAAWLNGQAWFDGPAWDQAAALPVGISRRR